MTASQRCVYEGSAKDYPRRGSEPVALEHAILDAYEKAMDGKEPRLTPEPENTPVPYRFRVVAIYIEGTNPPSDYKVELADH
jgi:hypothetical protein